LSPQPTPARAEALSYLCCKTKRWPVLLFFHGNGEIVARLWLGSAPRVSAARHHSVALLSTAGTGGVRARLWIDYDERQPRSVYTALGALGLEANIGPDKGRVLSLMGPVPLGQAPGPLDLGPWRPGGQIGDSNGGLGISLWKRGVWAENSLAPVGPGTPGVLGRPKGGWGNTQGEEGAKKRGFPWGQTPWGTHKDIPATKSFTPRAPEISPSPISHFPTGGTQRKTETQISYNFPPLPFWGTPRGPRGKDTFLASRPEGETHKGGGPTPHTKAEKEESLPTGGGGPPRGGAGAEETTKRRKHGGVQHSTRAHKRRPPGGEKARFKTFSGGTGATIPHEGRGSSYNKQL